MRKKLIFILLNICLCSWVNGQETIIPEKTAQPGYKTTFEANPFYKDNNKWNRCVIIEVAK